LRPWQRSRSQPFLSDGAFERRKAVLDLVNSALELFERAGHAQQPLNEVIREGFEDLGDRSSSPPPRCLRSDHAESLLLRPGGMAGSPVLDTQHIDVTAMRRLGVLTWQDDGLWGALIQVACEAQRRTIREMSSVLWDADRLNCMVVSLAEALVFLWLCYLIHGSCNSPSFAAGLTHSKSWKSSCFATNSQSCDAAWAGRR
jgi:hypothetical protein